MRSTIVLVGVALAGLLGCGRSTVGSATPTMDAEAPGAESGVDASTDAGPACFTNPQTYLEIINACTDAQAIDKTDDLSLMNLPDGGLQPLP
jgi:hypothetical protein